MTEPCYLCGFRVANPQHRHDKILNQYFTERSRAKSPQSECICNFCRCTLSKGSQGQLWYWNENKNKWSKMFGRSLTRLYQGDTSTNDYQLLSPVIEGTHTEKGVTLPWLKTMATRAEMREWLLNPPEPPFLISIAESGQKHILIWAEQAYSRDIFPVQFESDSVWINRAKFTTLINAFEALMDMGFSKSEIVSGDYYPDRLAKSYPAHLKHESVVNAYRNQRTLDLASHVAQQAA